VGEFATLEGGALQAVANLSKNYACFFLTFRIKELIPLGDAIVNFMTVCGREIAIFP
jgi:hypothetical protein